MGTYLGTLYTIAKELSAHASNTRGAVTHSPAEIVEPGGGGGGASAFAKASRDPQKLDPIHNDPRASFEERRLASLRLHGGGRVPTPVALPPLQRGQRVRHDTKEGYVVEARGDLYDVALDGGRVVSVPRSELDPIHSEEKVPDAPPPVEARLSSLTS